MKMETFVIKNSLTMIFKFSDNKKYGAEVSEK
jgi:hypothetical protein